MASVEQSHLVLVQWLQLHLRCAKKSGIILRRFHSTAEVSGIEVETIFADSRAAHRASTSTHH